MTALLDRQRLWTFGVALLVGIGGILYGYDIGVVSGALLFVRKAIPMSDAQVGVIVGAVLAGGLLGTLLAGPLADRYGRKIMIAGASIVFIVGVIFILQAHVFIGLLAARLLLGVGVGIVAVAVPLYVSEIVPADSRGKYVTFFQLLLTFGIVLAYFVDLYFTPTGNWRGMFAVVLVPATILLIGIIYLPESPRWLVANAQLAKARKVLRRTHGKSEAETELISIFDSIQQSEGTWRELFTKQVRLPLFIAVSIAILNQWTGVNTFLQYAPSILKSAGLGSDSAAMLGSVGIGLLNFFCTIIAIFFVDRIGRRPLLITGIAGVLIAETFLGVVNVLRLTPSLDGWLSLIGLFGFIVSYAIGPGVVVWLAISELFPTRVRGKGIAICLFFNSLAGTLLASLFLDMRNIIGVAGTYAFCAVFSFFYLMITCYLLPETKERSLEDIAHYFKNKRTLESLEIPVLE